MEFKFRAVDERSPPYISPSAAVSGQPFRGGFPGADPGRNADPIDVQRQLEKERIKEEMIAAEIARRRELEAEVRMELMMEREMVMRRASQSGMSFEEKVAMRFDPRYPFVMPHPVEGLLVEDHRWPLPHRGSAEVLPLQRLLPEAAVNEPKPEANKDKFIFLAKPEPSLSGAKRKATPPPAVSAGEPSSTVSTKKLKEEWSCALCQVSATSEKALNDHLQGKKHKVKEAGLRAERATKNSTNGRPPKKTRKPKPTEATGNPDPEPQANSNKDSTPAETKDKSSVQKVEDAGDKNGEIPLKKKQDAERSKKGEATPTPDNKKKRKFKYWCEFCQVGAYAEQVMESHKKGKKHVARLKELGLCETVGGSTRTPDTGREGENADTGKEANADAPELPPV